MRRKWKGKIQRPVQDRQAERGIKSDYRPYIPKVAMDTIVK